VISYARQSAQFFGEHTSCTYGISWCSPRADKRIRTSTSSFKNEALFQTSHICIFESKNKRATYTKQTTQDYIKLFFEVNSKEI
jgi:hypothetical protein